MKKVITVTLNPSIDVTLITDGLDGDRVNRVLDERREMGGKGINVSAVVQSLGADTLCICVAGQDNARELSGFLERANLRHEIVYTDGAVRENLMLRGGEGSLKLNRKGPEITSVHIAETKELLRRNIRIGDIAVFGGSLPANMSISDFVELVLFAKKCGAMVALDCDCLNLDYYRVISPWLIKPNIHELKNIFPDAGNSRKDIAASAKRLNDAGVENVVVSLGKDGLVYVSAGHAYAADVPIIEVKSTVGAGDSAAAGFIAGFIRGYAPEQCARLAAACGTATATLEGTLLTGQALAENILAKVTVREVNSE